MTFYCHFNDSADVLPPDFGAAAQAFLVGDIEELRAAEDEAMHECAAEEALGRHLFDGPANTAREAAILKRLVASGPLAVIVLGGAHDLTEHVRASPGASMCVSLSRGIRNSRD